MNTKKLLQEINKFSFVKSSFYQFEANLKNAKLFFSLRNDTIFTKAESLSTKGQKIVMDFGGNLNNGKNNFFSSIFLGLRKEKIKTNNQLFFNYLTELNE